MSQYTEIVLIDLFSGIGGFSKGLQDAGVRATHHYFSDIEPHAIQNYKYNYEHARYLGSVKYVCGTALRRKHPNAFFITCFGFPCQDLSVAGARQGFKGARSSLFHEAFRVIEESKTDLFIFENVEGLLSSEGGRDFATVLQTIRHTGLYECQWDLCDTAKFLPQRRRRVFFAGHLAEHSGYTPILFPLQTADWKNNSRSKNQGNVHRSKAVKYTQYDISGKGYNSQPDRIYDVSGLMATIPSARTDSKVKIKQPLEVIQLNPSQESGGKQPFQGNRFYSTQGLSPCLSTEAGRVKVRESVQAIMTPSRGTKRQNGRRIKQDGEPMFTLTTQDLHGVVLSENDGEDYFAIRTLTEIECERLQGFPDNWTLYGFKINEEGRAKLRKYKKENHCKDWFSSDLANSFYTKVVNQYADEPYQLPKTARYAACGNAITATIAEIIFTKLFKAYKPIFSEHLFFESEKVQ